MRIGLLSDSHGQLDRLRQAMAMLINEGAQALVHCGDIGTRDCVQALGGAAVPAYLVAGNMDRFHHGLGREKQTGLTFSPKTIEVPLDDGQYLIATHGHRESLLDDLIEGGQFPYVVHGHTHSRRNERFPACRVICPGSLHHPRSPRTPGCALLDTQADSVTFFDLT
jgi:putative phosphoesterase